MGILPLEFTGEMDRKTLKLTGTEKIDILGIAEQMKPQQRVKAIVHREDGTTTEIELRSRIDTFNEMDYFKNGGILQHVIRQLLLLS
jgi:aconitate hydratase